WLTGVPAPPVVTVGAALALTGALGLVAAGCALGATRDGFGDDPGEAIGWPLIAAGTAVAASLGPVAGPMPQGASPGALFVLALAAATAVAGRATAPLS